jgi:phosphatidylserine decarboxylase
VRLAPYARVEIWLLGSVTAITLLLLILLLPVERSFPLMFCVGAVELALLSFYRDPERTPPADADAALAPADGRILRVEIDAAQRLRIVIFLSVFDVHVNRSPCAGVVESVAYTPGAFLNAMRLEATERNESNTVVIKPDAPLPGPIRVRQIAGLLARRIVCVAARGSRLARGERFGMIKLGSQTELLLPDGPRWRATVAVGQRVRAGETIVARWQSQVASQC